MFVLHGWLFSSGFTCAWCAKRAPVLFFTAFWLLTCIFRTKDVFDFQTTPFTYLYSIFTVLIQFRFPSFLIRWPCSPVFMLRNNNDNKKELYIEETSWYKYIVRRPQSNGQLENYFYIIEFLCLYCRVFLSQLRVFADPMNCKLM